MGFQFPTIKGLSISVALLATLGVFTHEQLSASEASWIQVNGYDAHPTKILAKLKEERIPHLRHASVAGVIQQSGSQVVDTFRALPGLLILDVVEPNFKSRSAREEEQENPATELMQRIGFLQDSELFEYVEPNYIRYYQAEVDDPAYADGRLWGLNNDGAIGGKEDADIDANLAWDITVGSKDVVVAVIDTGIRYTHQELADNMWMNPGEVPDDGIDNDLNGVIDDVYGYNPVLESGDPLDVNDHGTNVASVIGALPDGNDVVGVAHQVSLMGIKALTDFGGEDGHLVKAIDYAVFMGADIINASWGGYAPSQSIFDAVALAQSEGILFVAGAGNDSLNTDTGGFYPASFDLDNILSVASFDRFDLLADHSNYGQISVDIAAPGSQIYMAGSGDEASGVGGGVDPDQDYDYADGTSFAAPHVSGVAVLLKAVFPDALATELKQMILDSAVQKDAYANKMVTGGRVNAFDALQVEPDGIMEVSVNPPSGSVLLTGEAQAFSVRVTDLVGIPDAEVKVLSADGTEYPMLNDGTPPDEAAGDAVYTFGGSISGLGDILLKILVTHPDMPSVETQVIYTLVERPKNNNFEEAEKVDPSGGVFTTYSKFADLEEGEPKHAGVQRVGDTLWWEWSPDTSGPVVIDTAGSGYDTILAVYQGNDFESLVEIGSVDQVEGRTAGYLQFIAQAGETYRIVVGSYVEDRGGSLRLRIEPNGIIDHLPPVVKITSPSDGIIFEEREIEISGYAFDPNPSVYGVKEVFLRVNGERVGGAARGIENWSVTGYLVPGLNEIEASAIDFSGNKSIIDRIYITRISSAVGNDHFHRAQVLTVGGDPISGDNTLATKQHWEPDHANNAGGHSVWYRFTAPADGLLTLTTKRSRIDTVLGLYTGNSIKDLTFVSSNDDASISSAFSQLNSAVRGGETYSIAVDGFGGASGEFSFHHTFQEGELFHANVLATQGGSIEGPSGLLIAGQEVQWVANALDGYEFVRWEGNVSEAAANNPVLSLNIASDLEITGVFAATSVFENFDHGGLTSAFSSTGWHIVEGEGFDKHGLQASQVADGGSAVLSLHQQTTAGRGSFHLTVSSEEGWDTLSFSIDGKLMGQWSGEVPWQDYQFDLAAGTHHFEWIYRKDAALSEGADLAVIDNLDLPIDSRDSSQQPAAVYVRPALDGTLDIEVQGVAGESYVIEASKGLQTWQVIHRGLADSEGRMQLRGVSGGGKAQSFYRAVTE